MAILLEEPFPIDFAGGFSAVAARVRERGELAATLERLGLKRRGRLSCSLATLTAAARPPLTCAPLFAEVLVPRAAAHGACMFDGGTDVGVMRMLGRARAQIEARLPIVGVIVDALAVRPRQGAEHSRGAALECHHTHFLLVNGSRWGDESPAAEGSLHSRCRQVAGHGIRQVTCER